jgi:hypothetical protein
MNEHQTPNEPNTEEQLAYFERRCAELKAENDSLSIYKRAMESMAAQFVHPKITALQLAELQLKDREPT